MDAAAPAHQRRIELQAPEDLTYLLANVRRAAAERINEAFPPVEGAEGEDELRNNIEKLVDEVRYIPPSKYGVSSFKVPKGRISKTQPSSDNVRRMQYITKTFTLTAPNLSINGLSIDDVSPDLSILSPTYGPSAANGVNRSEPDTVYAPFNARLRARVEELTREEEDLLRDIAALKKSVPGAAASAYGEAFRESLKRDEEALSAAKERSASGTNDPATGGSGKEGGGLDLDRLERQEDVERAYGRAVEGLARLKRDMPAVVARMERARGAGSYVVTER